MKCPNCKFENKDNAFVCSKCNYPVSISIKQNISFCKLFGILFCTYIFVVFLYLGIGFLFRG